MQKLLLKKYVVFWGQPYWPLSENEFDTPGLDKHGHQQNTLGLHCLTDSSF